jgi:hypothetical protein
MLKSAPSASIHHRKRLIMGVFRQQRVSPEPKKALQFALAEMCHWPGKISCLHPADLNCDVVFSRSQRKRERTTIGPVAG